jgi:hypothetical protein
VAQRTVIRLIDDLDGKEIEANGQTVSFTYNGTTYEIDLGEKNAKKLDDALAPFVAAARRVGGRQSRGSRPAAGDVDNRAVRAWATSNGIELSSRGRIPTDVIEKYKAAGN